MGGDMIEAFFNALFSGVCHGPETAIGVCANDIVSKRWTTEWFTSVSAAAAFVEKNTDRSDVNVYYHTALHDCREISKNKFARGRSETATRATAFWIDIDIAGEGHAKPGLVSSVRQLNERLATLSHQPSVVVRTLGGVHLYWLLREPVDLTVAEEKAHFHQLHKRLERALAQAGLQPDPTADHARVFRVPGCRDNKPGRNGGKIQVDFLEADLRYNLDEIAEMVDLLGGGTLEEGTPELFEVPRKASPSFSGALVFDPNAKLPADLVEWIDLQCQMDPKFDGTWRKKRRDLADQSQSGYDMSLASLLVRHPTITDQQMIDVLIYYRRKRDPNGRQDKFNAKYIMPMIAQARTSARKQRASEGLATATYVVQEGALVEREDMMDTLRNALELDGFEGIVKYLHDPHSIYKIRISGELYTLGDADTLLNYRRFKSRLFDVAKLVVNGDPRTWDDVARLLIHPSVLTEETLGEESEPVTQVTGWLQDFILSRVSPERPMQTFDEWRERRSGHDREPFVKDGLIHLSAMEVFTHLKVKLRLDCDKKVFYSMLKHAKCIPVTVPIREKEGGGWTSARVWQVPRELGLRGPETEAESFLDVAFG